MKKESTTEKRRFFRKILVLLIICAFASINNQHATAGVCTLTVSIAKVNPTCFGDCDGSLTANPAHGSGSYGYLWSNAAISKTISNQCAGTYTVTVTDQVTGCVVVKSAIIKKGKVGATITKIPASCGLCNGIITVIGKGGNGAPFTYLWSNGVTTNSINNACPNVNYTITVYDKLGCSFVCKAKVTNAGGAIDDNNACTLDQCINGVPTHTPIDCNDNNECTTDGCNPATGCTHTPVDCNDNNACTTDGCNPSTGCTHASVDCNDNNACTTDGCNPSTGCTHTQVDCNDNNACTTDGCNPSTGCTHAPVDCNDNNACTTDGCNPSTGCTHAPVDCNDNNACTTDGCNPSTGCTHTAVDCNDNNPCTTDGCNPSTGCTHSPGIACCNGNFTTYTQGGWHNTGTPGTYLSNHFDACIDTFVLGNPCGYTIKFSNAPNIKLFLPQGTGAAALTQSLVNPGSANITVLAGQVLSVGLALLFDNCDPNFGSSISSLGAQIYNVNGSPFNGWSVQAIYDTARKVLSGCPSNYTPSPMNVVTTDINEEYDEGGTSNHFLCPVSPRLSVDSDLSAKQVSARPNPFGKEVNIDITSDESLFITVSDITGRIFGEYHHIQQSFVLNTNWNNGMYFISVKNESGSYQHVLKVVRAE